MAAIHSHIMQRYRIDFGMKTLAMITKLQFLRHIPAFLFIGLAALITTSDPARAGDSHAEYYYPTPQTREVYASPLPVLPNVNKRSRVGFTVGLNQRQLTRGYAPQYHIFAKGSDGQKMIITAAGPQHYNTLYRLRALLAGLTATARTSPLFSRAPNPEDLNFLDLATMAGFTQVTVSDGDKIAHRIKLLSEKE